MSFAAIAGKLYTSITGIGNKPVLEDLDGFSVTFDAVTELTRDKSAVATKHAVEGEDLYSIVDNVKPEEPVLTLKAILSNYFTTNPFQPMSLVKAVKGTLLLGVDDTIIERIEMLHDWMDRGVLLKYSSPRIEFADCVISKVGDAISKDTGDGVMLSLTLERINIANAAEIEINLKKPQGAKKKPTKSRSLLKKIFS